MERLYVENVRSKSMHVQMRDRETLSMMYVHFELQLHTELHPFLIGFSVFSRIS